MQEVIADDVEGERGAPGRGVKIGPPPPWRQKAGKRGGGRGQRGQVPAPAKGEWADGTRGAEEEKAEPAAPFIGELQATAGEEGERGGEFDHHPSS